MSLLTDPTLTNLLSIIADQVSAETEEITPSNTFAELGFDSLDHMDLLMECEDQFNVEFSDEEAAKLLTVQDLYNAITRAHI